MRSIWSKFSSLAEDMSERATDFSILAEIWEKKENPVHKQKIEELSEMKEIQYFSTARPGAKRGGGAAIIVRSDRFHVTKLNIEIPKPLEVVWGLLRPKIMTGSTSKVILCSFYSPPNSKKKNALIDHISVTINKLKILHPKSSFIIAGDKNDLNDEEIISICPSFKQLVLKPTRKRKTLTVVITDLHRFYQEPIIVPPVPVDLEGEGAPSDHQGVLVIPVNSSSSPKKTKKLITVRPIKESSLHLFGQALVQEDWSFLNPSLSSTTLVESFQEYCSTLTDLHFPLKTVKLTSYDKPFFTEKLRHLKRRRQREYRRSGKSEKYLEIKRCFDEAFTKAAQDYKDKIIEEVVEGKRNSAYKAIKKLGNPSSTEESFQIPSHVDANLSAEESANLLADFFSKISQEFDPIDPSNFSPALKLKLSSATSEVPYLEEYQIYKKITAAKKPDSAVPGDLPKKVVKAFSVELATPMMIIFNKITESAEYPQQWIREHQSSIPKQYPPNSEEDLRNISCTPFFSKVYEAFLSEWLLPIVQPFLDPANCGGMKGTSSSHYLIRLLHFIHANLDKTDPHAVVLALIDLSKAFNRVDHTMVIEDLHDMSVPGWLLKIIISYLTGRTMVLKFQGAVSSPRSLPGSAPQGVFLGCFLFMVKFNGALLRPNIPRPLPAPEPIMGSNSTACTVKYIDDASQARALKLRKSLLPIDTTDRPKPLEFSEHTGFTINPFQNELQDDLNRLKQFTDKNLMTINQKKTQIMKFNFRKSQDFPPIFRIGDGPVLDIVSEAKILGIVIQDNLKFTSHVKYMIGRASKKIWTLRRLKLLNLNTEILTDFYCKEVRSILEYGVTVWNSSLTNTMKDQIERVQRICINIILCNTSRNISYNVGCTLLNLEPLFLRREELCIRFIQKTSQDPQHSDMFTINKNTFNTRNTRLEYREYSCRNKRFYDSPLCYLTRLLNKHPVKHMKG